MDLDLNVVKSAFKYLSGENEHICRLCLTSTENKKIYLDESVELKRPFLSEIVTYNDMFNELSIQTDPLLPQLLCQECASIITNTYLYKQLIPYYKEKWSAILSLFDSAIEQAKNMAEGVKTAFFLINEDQNAIHTSRTVTKEKEKALVTLKHLIKYKRNYSRVKKVPKVLLCNDCGEKFQSKIQLTKHHDKVHRKVNYVCSICFKMTTSLAQLEGHKARMHYPKKFKCPKCDKMFSTERLLAYHDKSYHQAVICKICFAQFPSKIEMKSHLDKHDVLNCPKCGKMFYSRQTFKAHEKICGNLEHKKPKFFCDICNKGYLNKSGLRSHLKTDHGFGINLYHCKWCNKKFDAASKLKLHSVVHTRERNYHCEQCGNRFVTQAALVYHTRLHTGERPFECEICGERFLSASRRMEHLKRKHIGPTKECPICHVMFVLNNQLNKHIQRHYNPQSKLFVRNLIETT